MKTLFELTKILLIVLIPAMGFAQQNTMSITVNKTTPTCYGSCDGAIDITVAGGFPPYSYSWSTGETSEDLSGLCAGYYMITVTDAEGQVKTKGIQVKNPVAVTIFQQTKNVTCAGGDDGAIDIRVKGGTPPYTYSWSNGGTKQDLGNLTVGIYCVTVTDALGCTSEACIEIYEPAPIEVTATSTNTVCGAQDCTGLIDVTVSGGTAPYTYAWSNGATTEDLNSVCEGVYTVTVTDANNCSYTLTVEVGCDPDECTGFRTQTQGGWGQCDQNGDNPGTVLYNLFPGAFPNGLVVGCDNTLTLTSSTGVCEFLPSGSTPEVLDANYVDPGSSYDNVFAGQVVALAVSIGFDNYDPDFGSSNINLADLIVVSGTFAGWTVQELFDEANAALGGCATNYSLEELNDAIASINENYVDGTEDNGYLTCPQGFKWAGSDNLVATSVVYPNPTTNMFTVEFVKVENTQATVNIYDMFGRLIESVENAKTGLQFGSKLAAGVYFCEIKQGNLIETVKIQKVK